MEDSQIITLYWQRSETAIVETQSKYGSYCYSIANNILNSHEDAEESVNDTYMAAWESMPPHKPDVLSAFLGKLTRRISIDKWRRRSADKRGGGTVTVALEELAGCIPSEFDLQKEMEAKELAEVINGFLDTLSSFEKEVFLRRYFYLSSIDEIAKRMRISDSKVKSMLHRIRNRLRTYLEKEGYK